MQVELRSASVMTQIVTLSRTNELKIRPPVLTDSRLSAASSAFISSQSPVSCRRNNSSAVMPCSFMVAMAGGVATTWPIEKSGIGIATVVIAGTDSARGFVD